MSGGHFDYKQYEIDRIADEVEQLLLHPPDWLLDQGFNNETRQCFIDGYILLRMAAVYAQRIDWFVSGDDGETTFHERLVDDIARLERDLEEKSYAAEKT